jgi:Na+/phosphate symporter
LAVKKITLGLVGFALFYVALGLMKDSAHALTPLMRGWLSIGNMVDSMGFGWLMAYIIQSGSPVAAIAMSLLSAGAITPIQAYTMVAGSRLGASLIVLQIGAIYALRQRDKWSALTAGILSLFRSPWAFWCPSPRGAICDGRTLCPIF